MTKKAAPTAAELVPVDPLANVPVEISDVTRRYETIVGSLTGQNVVLQARLEAFQKHARELLLAKDTEIAALTTKLAAVHEAEAIVAQGEEETG